MTAMITTMITINPRAAKAIIPKRTNISLVAKLLSLSNAKTIISEAILDDNLKFLFAFFDVTISEIESNTLLNTNAIIQMYFHSIPFSPCF
jgi:hypothetical protein